MTHQEREAINTLMLQANVLMKGWLREREEGLALQRAADARLTGFLAKANQPIQPASETNASHD